MNIHTFENFEFAVVDEPDEERRVVIAKAMSYHVDHEGSELGTITRLIFSDEHAEMLAAALLKPRIELAQSLPEPSQNGN